MIWKVPGTETAAFAVSVAALDKVPATDRAPLAVRAPVLAKVDPEFTLIGAVTVIALGNVTLAFCPGRPMTRVSFAANVGLTVPPMRAELPNIRTDVADAELNASVPLLVMLPLITIGPVRFMFSVP